jgi:Zn-dependent peptidase ImmA (M78 family)/transcriptional regulator with XRE-family HTH domain
MPKEEIPITPAILVWARERAGYSLEEAAKDFKNIEAWEAGSSHPTYPQLERLADKFKIPIAVFFFPEPPSVPPIAETFRTLPESQLSEIPRRIRFLLRKAKALQLNLMELNPGGNPAPRLITRDLAFESNIQIDVMAQEVRQYIGVTLEEQRNWASIEAALDNWRRALGNVGIFVFKDAFKVDEYSGFCLYDETFPIIYVNNTTAKSRQIFTLFHELAHLLFHTSGIDTLGDEYITLLADDARRIEIICNRFAAAFLVPEADFEEALARRAASEGLAEELAARFHVSREFVFRKFLDRGLIDEDTYSHAARRWAAQSKPSSGGDFYNTQFSYLGPEYIRIALGQFYKNRINDTQLADYLNIAPKNLAAFEARFSRRAS